jgi:cytochrome P450
MESTVTPFPKLRFSNTVEIVRKGLYYNQVHSSEKYPEAVIFSFGRTTVHMLNHPQLAQHILQKNYSNYNKGIFYDTLAILLGKGLINNDGASWHKQRTLIQPSFHRETLRHVSEIVTSSVNRLLEKWKSKEGTVINFSQEMAELTIGIVARALFTTDVTPEMVQTIWRNVNYMNEMMSSMIQNPLSLPWSFPTPGHRKARKYIAELDAILFGIIEKRRNERSSKRDLLQLLLDARYEDTNTGMDDKQLRDELMTVFVAGHETTVNALSWTWYLLKQHKEEEEKLKSESLQFASGRDPVFEDVPPMEYGRHVMNESMRMYPPVAGTGRRSIADDHIGHYFVPANSEVGVNIAGIHYHPAFWQNPFEYMPKRFENFDLKGENRFVFMPFGGGPRICIGNSFAMMEMQLINAILASRVDMELYGKPVKPQLLITLKPRNGVMMLLKKVKS